jgi:membrane protein DedA with SNARE-associated domain
VFEQLVDLISGSAWSYVLILGLAYVDVLFPLVPSETAVIAAGVLAAAGGMSLPAVLVLAAVGAFLGDNTAYLIGHRFEEPIRRALFRGEKARERLRWAERQLEERGGELIVIARFIPGGRTAVCVSAGWLEMTWRRFVIFDGVAAVVWATYASLLGYLGGTTFEDHPWKGIVAALAIAFAVAGLVELVRWLRRRGAEGHQVARRAHEEPRARNDPQPETD